jgi:hypothetical protein
MSGMLPDFDIHVKQAAMIAEALLDQEFPRFVIDYLWNSLKDNEMQ